MAEPFVRTETLIGKEKFNKLSRSRVAVFGVGGVGGFVVEALARSGVGAIALFDGDTVSESNINRQLIANEETVGKSKVEIEKEHVLSINPNAKVETTDRFITTDEAKIINLLYYDYIVDAIDSVGVKIELIKRAKDLGVPIISCMGTGGKLDATRLKVTDVYKTEGCPLARVVRKELKQAGVKSLKVVFSDEPTSFGVENPEETQTKADGKKAPPSMIFVPGAAGLIIASEVIKDLIE